jgi:hypothetical protein
MTMRKIALLTAASAIASMPRAFDNATAAPKRAAPVITGVASGLVMPQRQSKRGSESLFPFDSLTEIGMAFGVKDRDAKSLSSIISNANRKAREPKRDATGAVVYKTTELKDANGSVVGTTPTTEPEMVATKHFFAVDVTREYREANKDAFAKGGAFEGATVLVFRDEPKA